MTWSPSYLVQVEEQHDAMTWEPAPEQRRPMPDLVDTPLENPIPPVADMEFPVFDLSEFQENDSGLFGSDELNAADFEPINAAPVYWPDNSAIGFDSTTRREHLLSLVPLLRGHLSDSDVVIVALFVNSPCTTRDILKWVRENNYTDNAEFSNRQAVPFSVDSKLPQHLQLFSTQGSGSKGTRSLTELGVAAAELLLGYPLNDRPFELIRRLPLAYRLRYAFHHHGAMTSSEYSKVMVRDGLNISTTGAEMTARTIISGCSAIKASQGGSSGSLFSVNNVFMNRLYAPAQWARRVLSQNQLELGMSILAEILYFYAENDLANAPTCVQIDQSAFGSFVDASWERGRFKAINIIPEGTLIPAECFRGAVTRVPDGMTNAARFNLISFPFIPSLEGRQFYLARSDVFSGYSISLDTNLTLVSRPTINPRQLTAAEITRVRSAAVREARDALRRRIQGDIDAGCAPVVKKKRVPANKRTPRDSSPKRVRRKKAALERELLDLAGPAPVLI